MSTGPGSPEVEPRAAATLVIVRDSARGPEVLLTIRPEHLRFMGGAAVFPGGAIDDADGDPRWAQVSVISPDQAADATGEPPRDALAAYVCAIREAYEEVGVLFADGPITKLARPTADDASGFLRACVEAGIRLRTDLLVPAGRWVTPLGAPVRFDTRFFVVRSPAGWAPEPDPTEVADALWIGPTDALDRLRSGQLLMAPPTIETLQRLCDHDDVDALLAALQPGATPAERLSPLVQRVVAPNPGPMTGPGTNCYIVGSGPTWVIDPGDADPVFIDQVAEAAIDLAGILITHRHRDHVGGVRSLLDRTQVGVHAFGSSPAGGVRVEPLEDRASIDVGSTRLLVLHTPGHAADHLCFYLEGAASLFAGDNILGEGTAVIAPPEGNMRSYLASLERMRERHISRIYPGHFDPLDGGDRIIEHYLEHRAARRAAILAAIDDGPGTLEDIVERVYVDTPSALHPIAALQVQAVLEMLEEDLELSRSGNRWVRSGVG